jgi:hypothetical protein
MKKSVALIFTAIILIVAGCCTTPHVTKWEYKVTVAPRLLSPASQSSTNVLSLSAWGAHHEEISKERRENIQNYLDELGKDGWILINEDENDGTLFLKRPIK